MSLVIDLPRSVEVRLNVEASRAGYSTEEYAGRLLTDSLPPQPFDVEEQKRLNTPTIALLKSWLERANVPSTPEERAESEADLEEFMRNMNAPRKKAGERLLYPDVESTRILNSANLF